MTDVLFEQDMIETNVEPSALIQTTENCNEQQDKEVFKARHNENMRKLSERIEAWRAFKKKQDPSWEEAPIGDFSEIDAMIEKAK